MVTLKDFYHTEKWKKFAKLIKQERLNEDGQLICDYCGHPILKSYDCIAHHSNVYLSEENVNDASIAFNPENIQLVHHRCHNMIHEKTCYKRRGEGGEGAEGESRREKAACGTGGRPTLDGDGSGEGADISRDSGRVELEEGVSFVEGASAA